MKKLYTILIVLLVTASTFAQAPEKMSYQAVVRDATNTLVTNQSVGMQISILQATITGASVYTETQTITTNLNGLVSLEIGTGSTSDNFATIDWSAGPYFIKTETDPSGGSSYTITGASQIMSVPFALYANTSGGSETNATNIANNTTAITANTAKVGYTDALVSANTDVVANTAKGGITSAQSTAITANTAKVGYTEALVSANTDVVANTSKVGYTEALVSANSDVVANTLKVGYTEALVSANSDVVANTAKTVITTAQASEITTNNAKTGITTAQSNAITANTLKVGYTEALVSANTAVAANTLKVGYTDGLVSANTDVTANTSKVGYTDALVSVNTAVAANTLKVGYTEALVSANTDVAANIVKITNATHTGDVTGATVLTITNDAVTTNKILNGNVTNAKLDKANIPLSGFDAAAEDVALGDNKLTGVADPTDAKDAATKAYVDALEIKLAALETRIKAIEPIHVPAVIGDIREGGVVFYIAPNNNTDLDGDGIPDEGLVCAFEDYWMLPPFGGGNCNITDLPNLPNVPYNGGNPSGPSTEIGDGMSNTNNMLIDCGSENYIGNAAIVARLLGPKWFLPSIKELNEMYVNKEVLNDAYGFTKLEHKYWASNEADQYNAWFINFGVAEGSSEMDVGVGEMSIIAKSQFWMKAVRAVRAF